MADHQINVFTKFFYGPFLQLANSFPGDAELIPNFLEGFGGLGILHQAVFYDYEFPRGQVLQGLLDSCFIQLLTIGSVDVLILTRQVGYQSLHQFYGIPTVTPVDIHR